MSAVLFVMLMQLPEPHQVSADPNAALAEAGWRSGGRRSSARPRVFDIGDAVRFRLRLPSFVELSNSPGTDEVVPYQFWRARIQLEGLVELKLNPELIAGIALRAGHESDHPTASTSPNFPSYTGYVQLNAVALIASLRWLKPNNALNVEVTARAHLVTCTRDPDVCGSLFDAQGDRSYELSVGISEQRALSHTEVFSFDVFASAFASYLAPTPLIFEERRVTFRGGVGFVRSGGWSRFYTSRAGSAPRAATCASKATSPSSGSASGGALRCSRARGGERPRAGPWAAEKPCP